MQRDSTPPQPTAKPQITTGVKRKRDPHSINDDVQDSAGPRISKAIKRKMRHKKQNHNRRLSETISREEAPSTNAHGLPKHESHSAIASPLGIASATLTVSSSGFSPPLLPSTQKNSIPIPEVSSVSSPFRDTPCSPSVSSNPMPVAVQQETSDSRSDDPMGPSPQQSSKQNKRLCQSQGSLSCDTTVQAPAPRTFQHHQHAQSRQLFPKNRVQTEQGLFRDTKGKRPVHSPPRPFAPQEVVVLSSREASPISISSTEQISEQTHLKDRPSQPRSAKLKKDANASAKLAPGPAVVIIKQDTASTPNGIKSLSKVQSSPPKSSRKNATSSAISDSPSTPATPNRKRARILDTPNKPWQTASLESSSSDVRVVRTPSPPHIMLNRHGASVSVNDASQVEEISTFPLRSGRLRTSSIQSPPKAPKIPQDATTPTLGQELDNILQQDAQLSMATMAIKPTPSKHLVAAPTIPTVTQLKAQLNQPKGMRTNGEIYAAKQPDPKKAFEAMRKYQDSQAKIFKITDDSEEESSSSSEGSEEEETGVAVPSKYKGLFKLKLPKFG